MNLQNDRVTGIVAGVIIVLAILYTVFSVMRKLHPPQPAPAAINLPPPTTASPPANANAGNPPANAGPPASSSGAPGANAPSSGGAPANPQETASFVPGQPFKIVVRDPFVLTPSYAKELKNSDVSESISAMEPNALKNNADAKSKSVNIGSKPSRKASGNVSLPPAFPNFPPEPLPGARSTSNGEFAGHPRNGSIPSTNANNAATKPGDAASSETTKPKPPEYPYVLTGTIDGETPMAILKMNDRNYLVKVGDWLEGDFQVLRISPRRVVLSDPTGRSKILNLGVIAHAS
jgi:hypothetical protein